MEQPKKKLAKPNVATRQDSLELRNNAIRVRDYYNRPEYIPYTKSNFFSDKLKKEKTVFKKNDKANEMYLTGQTLMRHGLRDNDYRVEVDKNKYKQRELSNGILDKSSPMQLFDKRITPTSYVKKINTKQGEYLGDVVEMYQYDPLAITPFDMLSEKEKKERVEKYGRNGVPDSYQSGITTPPKTIKGKQVKEEGNKGMVLNKTLTPHYIYQKPLPLKEVNSLQPKEVVKETTELKGTINITQPARVPKSYSVEESSPMQFGAHTTKYEVSDLSNLSAGETGTGSTRKITPKYAEGGTIDPPIKTVKDQAEFNNNWFANRVIKGKPLNVKSRVTVPNKVNIKDLNTDNSEGTTYGQYDPSNKEVTLDPRFKEKIGIPAHEQYHEFQDKLKKEDINKYKSTIDTPIREAVKNIKTTRAYDANPEEISARLQQLRWGKDFKPDQVVTPKDVEKVDLGSYDLQDFDREAVVNLLNSVAYNDNTRDMNKAKKLPFIKGKPLLASGGRLPYSDRHIAPSALVGGVSSMASLIPDPLIGGIVGGAGSILSGILGAGEKRKEERRVENEAKSTLLSNQLTNDAIVTNNYDNNGTNDVQYYAKGGTIPTTGQYQTKGGTLNPISSTSEVAEGNTHGEKTIDNSYGITLEKGNQPVAEIEDQEVVKDGQKVYSDRLMYNSTQTFADKAKQLGVKAGKIEKRLEGTKDSKDRNGLERTLAGIKMGEEVLYQKQEQEKQFQGEQELNSLPKMYTGGIVPNPLEEYATTPSGNQLALPSGSFTPTANIDLKTAPTPIKGNEGTKQFFKDLVPTLMDNVGNAILTANTPNLPKPIYNPTAQIDTNVNVNPQLAELTNTANTIQDAVTRNSNSSNVARANIASSRLKTTGAKLGILAGKEQTERGLRNQQAQMIAANTANNNAKLEEYNANQFARKNEISARVSANLANLSSDVKDAQTRRDQKDVYAKMTVADLINDPTGAKLQTYLNSPDLFNLTPQDREMLLKEAKRRKNNSILNK